MKGKGNRKFFRNFLNSSEAADELGVSLRRLRTFIESGELPAVKDGGAWFIKRGDLMRFKAKLIKATSQPKEGKDQNK